MSEDEFDTVYARIRDRGLQYWADPSKQHAGKTYLHNGGRGMYFDDPDGHFLEVIDPPLLGFDGVEPALSGWPSYHHEVMLKFYICDYLNLHGTRLNSKPHSVR